MRATIIRGIASRPKPARHLRPIGAQSGVPSQLEAIRASPSRRHRGVLWSSPLLHYAWSAGSNLDPIQLHFAGWNKTYLSMYYIPTHLPTLAPTNPPTQPAIHQATDLSNYPTAHMLWCHRSAAAAATAACFSCCCCCCCCVL